MLKNPIDAINQYLAAVYEEAVARGYNFNSSKVDWDFKPILIEVTIGQMDYEQQHLLAKLKVRDLERFNRLESLPFFQPHTLFKIVEGDLENWEVVNA